jgi:hypothetical protein
MQTQRYYDVCLESGNASHSGEGSVDEDGKLGESLCCVTDGIE